MVKAIVVEVDQLDEVSTGGFEVETVLDKNFLELVFRLWSPLELGLRTVTTNLALELGF